MKTQNNFGRNEINEQSFLENSIRKIVLNSKWFPVDFESIYREISRLANTRKRQTLEQIIEKLIKTNILVEIDVKGNSLYYHRQNVDKIITRIVRGIASFHKEKPFKKGISISEIRKYISFNKKKKKQKAVSRELLDFTIDIAAKQKLINIREDIISLPDFCADETKQNNILNYIENDKLVSRIDKEIIHKEFQLTISEFNSIIFDLKNESKILTIQKNFYMPIERFEETKRIIVAHLRKNGATPIRELIDLFNSSRRPMSIFLDYLESLGILKMVDGKRDLV